MNRSPCEHMGGSSIFRLEPCFVSKEAKPWELRVSLRQIQMGNSACPLPFRLKSSRWANSFSLSSTSFSWGLTLLQFNIFWGLDALLGVLTLINRGAFPATTEGVCEASRPKAVLHFPRAASWHGRTRSFALPRKSGLPQIWGDLPRRPVVTF